ncbi:NYN domain-containing protein [Nonomuraea sp. NPDC050691]|uniref:NYN domain-containing protein n=1 Tax=Nonomuraea sp. NPDC050691 TaxID=3155661 RepID=UPI0033CFDB5B
MDRCALFVDAGYLLADGAMAVHGTRHREAVAWDYPGLLQLMSNLARERTGLPLLRCYWYEATVEGRRTPEHDVLADIPGLKLRLSRIRPGRREGVDAQVHRDLMTLARNNAICDAVVVSGDEDLAQVVCDAQDLGIRVTVVHIATEGGWAVSRTLRQEGDDLIELGNVHLRPFVNLVTGISEVTNGHHPLSNGHAAAHAATHSLPPAPPPSSSLPTPLPAPKSSGSHAAPPTTPSPALPATPPAQPEGQPSSGRGQSSTPSPSPTYYHQEPASQAPATGPLPQQPASPQTPSTGQFAAQPSNGAYQQPSQPAQSSNGSYQPFGAFTGPQSTPPTPPSTSQATTLADAVKAAHREGHDFGESVARDAPALWLEAVLARKPRMPSDLEARLLQGSSLPIDFLLHDEVRHALRRGFWDALERARH